MDKNEQQPSFKTGTGVIRSALDGLPASPGVYRMIGAEGDVLYVGKAKALKKRVASYTQITKLPVRLQRMVALTRSMEFVHTHTEAEALLLESNLIKKLKPRFNILLRDDKSFPYILLTGDHDFPQVVKHRGARKRDGDYYGPFAGAGDVNRTISALQRIFMLRNCPDSTFNARTRPCLQYHIKRCTAPCVGLVDQDTYAAQIEQAKAFLEGKSEVIRTRLESDMRTASTAQEYERAAELRDRLRALAAVSAKQDINLEGVLGDADVIALVQDGGRSAVQVFFFRGGRNYGNRTYFPRHDAEDMPEAIMGAFIAQFYENKAIPPVVLTSHDPSEKPLLAEALSARAERKVQIVKPQRGRRVDLLDFVLKNAKAALSRHTAEAIREEEALAGVAKLFALDSSPERIEIYDNSHISGTNMVGGMVVAGPDGFIKKAYRKFNIKQAGAADDYGMMREVLTRRFERALKEDPEMSGADWPDLLLIDGGRGQLNICHEVLAELGLVEQIPLVGIAKGPDRNAGRETFYIKDREEFTLPPNDPTLYYLQRLRDEAHRFAIGAHRTRRKNQMSASPLDEVPGIGAKRKAALLRYFGSAKAVEAAGIPDLQKVEGISESVAQKIYDHFH